MRYLRYRIEPRLSWAGGELSGTPLGDDIVSRILKLGEVTDDRPVGAALDNSLAAHRAFLDAATTGIPLTQAGYLPPAVVRTLAPQLPTMRDWIFAIEREVHAQPVLYFREHLTRVGLLRKAKGRLTATVAGARGHTDSGALWAHLAERLVPTRVKFDEIASALILLQVATSTSREPNLRGIADTMTALGWSNERSGAITRNDVQWVWNDLWAGLGNVGVPVDDGRHSRIASDEAVLLIRAALLVPGAAASTP